MESIRSFANSIGISGNISILGDFFGFFRRRLPTDPSGNPVEISIKRQIDRLKGEYFNINCIRIGNNNFTAPDENEIDFTIYRIRNINNQVNIGVGRVQHYGVDSTDSNGLDSPTSRDDLVQITRRWTVPNDGIDLFFPVNMNVPGDAPGTVILGLSPRPGPCESKNSFGMNGSVCGLWGEMQTSRSGCHEIGHYLGLEHQNSSPNNLMCQSRLASNIETSVNLTNGQSNTVRAHCLMNDGS